MNGLSTAALASIGALLLAVLTVLFPTVLLLGLAGVSLDSVSGIALTTMLFLIGFVIYFAILYVLGWIVSRIPRNVAYVLAVLLIVVGVLLLAPEVDVIGLFTLLFTVGTKAAGSKPKPRKG